MKYFIVLFLFITHLAYTQNKNVNELFFNIPLNESRDSIYNYCINSGLFIKKNKNEKVTRKGKEIKVFSGYLRSISPKLIKRDIDSVEIQLSTGSVSREGEKESKELLIFWSYYYTNNLKSATGLYRKLKKQINKICAEKPYHFKNFEQRENDLKEKEVGYSDKWYFKNNEIQEIELTYTILEKNDMFLIKVGYKRNE